MGRVNRECSHSSERESQGTCGQSEINRLVLIPVYGSLNGSPGCISVNVGQGVPAEGCLWGLGGSGLQWAALLCVCLRSCRRPPTAPKLMLPPPLSLNKLRSNSHPGSEDCTRADGTRLCPRPARAPQQGPPSWASCAVFQSSAGGTPIKSWPLGTPLPLPLRGLPCDP